MSTSYPSNLSDTEWTCLQRHLPAQSERGRPPIHSLRSIFDAIFYVLRTGCPWRYLPANFLPWQTVFSHFRQLRLKGTWTLAARGRCTGLNANGKEGIPTQVQLAWIRHPRENGRGVIQEPTSLIR